jgi:succinate dehydrogenase/fumarate reductase-like Fe-S protein
MSKMNWNRVQKEERNLQAEREGLFHDHNRVSADATADLPPKKKKKKKKEKDVNQGAPQSQEYGTDIGCHLCSTPLLLLVSPEKGKPVGARCNNCKMRWALGFYDQETQGWLMRARRRPRGRGE